MVAAIQPLPVLSEPVGNVVGRADIDASGDDVPDLVDALHFHSAWIA